MSSRIIFSCFALLVAASGCAMEVGAPDDDEFEGSGANWLTSADPVYGTPAEGQPGETTDTPTAPGQEIANDSPGKPQPDPWLWDSPWNPQGPLPNSSTGTSTKH